MKLYTSVFHLKPSVPGIDLALILLHIEIFIYALYYTLLKLPPLCIGIQRTGSNFLYNIVYRKQTALTLVKYMYIIYISMYVYTIGELNKKSNVLRQHSDRWWQFHWSRPPPLRPRPHFSKDHFSWSRADWSTWNWTKKKNKIHNIIIGGQLTNWKKKSEIDKW